MLSTILMTGRLITLKHLITLERSEAQDSLHEGVDREN